MTRVYITEVKRSAIGRYLGALSNLSPLDLGSQVLRAVLESDQVPVEAIEEVIVGNVLSAGHGQNLARQIALEAGLPMTTPAYTVNMVCGSGLKAVYEGYTKIKAGENQALIVGGVESMSQAAFVLDGKSRKGMAYGGSPLVDSLYRDGLSDAFGGYAMGVTAENLAQQYDISRQAQDAYAYQSQVKAQAAQQAGLFDQEIVAVTEVDRKGNRQVIDRDEYINYKTSPEKLASLRPAFQAEGTVTAGNASGINDGAAFLCLVSQAIVDRYQLTPLAEVLGFGQAGVDPSLMGIGPVGAIEQVLERTGVPFEAVDRFELNEAFAVQALAVSHDLVAHHGVPAEWLAERTNVHGGAIALGHPIGASGVRVLATLCHELVRSESQYGLASLCIGGGMGIASLIKRYQA